MSTGPRTTFDTLSKSENRAATDILIWTLRSKDPSIRRRGLSALLDRRDPVGHQEVLSRLAEFDPACREIILQRSYRLQEAASAAVKEGRDETCGAACEAIVAFRMYDAMPGLVAELNSEEGVNNALAADTIRKLAEGFYAELSGAEQQSGSQRPTNMDTLRGRMTTSLEEAARKYYKHGRPEAIEAFLLVAKPQNPTLRQILRNPDDKSYEPLLEILSTSEHGGVIRLLLGFLDEATPPRSILDIYTRRRDSRFVENFLRRTGARDGRTRNYGEHVSRLDALAWAKPGDETLDGLDDEGQTAAVCLINASAMKEEQTIEVLGHLLLKGNLGGRRAAARALTDVKGNAVAALVVRGLNDSDPQVRAHLLKQLRRRGVPGAMSLLMRMADDPNPEIKEALREAMPEFGLRQFMMTFESMPEEMRRLAGYMVHQIHPDSADLVSQEMRVLSPVRRRRAVQVAAAMGLVQELEWDLARAVSDDDHLVRVAAAMALAESQTVGSWEALRDAMLDRSVVVQEAAEKSLTRISHALRDGLGKQAEGGLPEGGSAEEEITAAPPEADAETADTVARMVEQQQEAPESTRSETGSAQEEEITP